MIYQRHHMASRVLPLVSRSKADNIWISCGSWLNVIFMSYSKPTPHCPFYVKDIDYSAIRLKPLNSNLGKFIEEKQERIYTSLSNTIGFISPLIIWNECVTRCLAMGRLLTMCLWTIYAMEEKSSFRFRRNILNHDFGNKASLLYWYTSGSSKLPM